MTLPARVDRAIARRRPVVPMANFDIHLPGRMGRRYGVDVIRDARDHLSERSISPDREVNPPRNPLVDATPAPLPVGRPLPDVARVTHAATRVVTERRLTPLAGVSPVNPRTRRTRMAESPVVSAIASSSGRSRLAPITASTINPPQVTATNPTRLSPMANPPMPGAVVDRGGPTRLNPIIPSEPRATPTVDVPNGASFRPAPLLTESVSVVDVPRRDSFRPTPLPTESVPVFSGGVFLGSESDASSETGSLDGESVFEVDDEAMRFERGAEEDGMVDGALGTSETGVGGVESGLPELVPDQPTAALSDSNPVDDAAAEAARLAEEQARVAEEQVRVAAEQVRLAEEAREKEAADNVRRAAQPPVTTPPMSDEEAAALVDEFMREESGVVDDSASPVVDESVVGAEAVGSVLARPTGDALDSLLEEYDGVGGGSENDLDDIFDGDELPLSLDSASSLSRNPIVLPVIGAPTVSVGDGVVASAVDSVVTTVVTDDPAVLTTIEDDITITDLDDEDRLASPQTALEQELKEAFEAREKRMGERRTPSDRPVFNPDLAREIRAAANRVGAVSGGDATLDVPSAVSDVVEDDEVDGVAPDSMPLSLSTAPVLDGDAAVLSASDLDLSAAFGNAINAAQAEIERINNANARMAEYDDMPVLDLDEVGEKMAVTTQTNVVDESEELEDVGGVPLFDEDLEDEPESKLAAEAAKDAEGDAVEIVEDEAEAATPLVAEQVADADQDKKEAEEVATKEDVEQKAEEEEEKKKRDAAANTQAGDAVTPAAEKIKLPPDVKAEEKEDGSMMMKLLYLVIFTACIAAIVFFPVIAPLALPGAMATAATGIVKNVKPRNDAKVPDPQSSPPSPPPTPEVTEAATDAVKGLVTALSSNDANLENTDATDAIPPKPAVVIDPNAPQQVDTGRAA